MRQNRKDVAELRATMTEIKVIVFKVRQMKCTGVESKIHQALLESLNDSLYHTEDLMMNIDEKSHWETIKKFQREVHRL